MAIYYNVHEIRNRLNDKSEKLAYAAAKSVGGADLEGLADLISERSTVSAADVKAVLDSLGWASAFLLKNGMRVDLGDLGRLHVQIKSRSTATSDEFGRENILRAKPVFTPGRYLRDAMSNATFSNLKDMNACPTKPIADEGESGGESSGESGGGEGGDDITF